MLGMNYSNNLQKDLKSSVRQNDELCRVGGDEFLVLLNNITNDEQIEKIRQKDA